MKALVAVNTDQILGFAMLGAQAGEVMAVVQMAMLGGLPFTALRDGILAHPTLAEGLNMLFASGPSRSEPISPDRASDTSGVGRGELTTSNRSMAAEQARTGWRFAGTNSGVT